MNICSFADNGRRFARTANGGHIVAEQVQVLEQKYKDLRVRIVEGLDRIDERLEYYAQSDRDKQVLEMERKYKERKDKLFAELDKVDSRLASYASLKSASNKNAATPMPVAETVSAEPEKKKMYRGRPVG